MWAKLKKPRYIQHSQRGFTIVELLIVIVVIGILAAITIVAYNGIQGRAHAAQAQSDAGSVTQLLGISNVNNGSYPSDLSTIDNGGPMSVSDGTSYAYHPGNANASYCMTVTNASSSYVVTNTAVTPVPGSCPGDGTGGVTPVTNLAVNPSFETNLSGLGAYNVTLSNPSPSDAYSGSRTLLATRTTTSGATGPWWDAADITPGHTYTVGMDFRANNSQSRTLIIEWLDSGFTTTVSTSTLVSGAVPTGTWQRIGGTAVAPAGAAHLRLTFYTFDAGATTTYVEIDGIMITDGSQTYKFADGNTTNWAWSGTANASSSTGPPL